MHLNKIVLKPEEYPVKNVYPFNLSVLNQTPELNLKTNITFFIGENGSGKSTLLKAITRRCGIYIWQEYGKTRFEYNPYEDMLYKHIDVTWTNGKTPGAYFSSESYEHLTNVIDDWASADPALMGYFGGKSLITQSHGESFMSFFKARYKIKGVYFLDEPETALSPKRQIEFLKLLADMSFNGNAQFIIATHSPILLSCPDAAIISFDGDALEAVSYKDTEHFRIYRAFMANPESFTAKD